MKFKIAALALFTLLTTSSCTQKKKDQERTYPVEIGEVTQKDISIFIKTIGNVNTLQYVQIRPQVGGVIIEAYVKEGQFVKKGDPLYQIDPRPYEANLEKAKAALAKDNATLKYSQQQAERNEKLVSSDYISKLTYEQYLSQVELNKGQVQSDEADIKLALLNLEWTAPVSPIDGKVSQFVINPGNLVVANDPNAVTDIRKINPADIWFNITQSEFIQVQRASKNGPLKFSVILPQTKRPREGQIYFIDNHVDTSTGTILVKGTVANEDEMFWPGEFVDVQLYLRKDKNALLVPEEAVKLGQEGSYIYVYHPETSKVEYRKVVKGEKLDNLVQIISGIKKDEKVVISGQNNLLPDAKVYIPKAS